MGVYVYIVQNETSGRYYCGQTNSLKHRIRQHNDPDYTGSLTTKRFKGPWKLIWSTECLDRSEAMKLETKVKKRGIGRYLEAQLVESRPAEAGD